MRIENILVPVDFSPPSRLALNYGIELARKFRARLTMLHVVESMGAFTAGFPASRTAAEKAHREQALRMLSALVGSEDQDDLDLRIVLKSGDIQDEISDTIREQRADLLVMGTHGRGLIGRWLIGSVTQSVLRKVPVPVLTVCHTTGPLSFKRIMFATDFSEASKRAMDFLFALARTMRSDVIVFHDVEPVALSYAGGEMVRYVAAHNVEEAKTKLADIEAEGARQHVKVETTLAEGLAAKEILKAAEDNDADLLLISVKHKGLIERAFLGATAEEIIREAHIPVLSIPWTLQPEEEMSEHHHAESSQMD